jgi:lipopolysaccharide transport protein LptA
VKKNYLIAGLCVLAGSLFAQTNVTDLPKPERPPTLINSDTAEFDLTARRAIYRGHVQVDDPQMTLTCVLLTADLPQPGGSMKHIVAETNVVIFSIDEKSQTNHATSDKAIYDFNIQDGVTNETVTLTGHAKMENSQGTLTGEPIIWDRQKNRLTAMNQKMVFNQSATSEFTGTNAAPHKTNSPPIKSALPIKNTNLPPGTIENIDRITNPSTTQ